MRPVCYSSCSWMRVNAVSNQTIEHEFRNVITCKETNNARISVMKLPKKNNNMQTLGMVSKPIIAKGKHAAIESYSIFVC